MSGWACIVRRAGDGVPTHAANALAPAIRARGPEGEDVWQRGAIATVCTGLDPGDARLAPCVAQAGSTTVVGQVRIDDRARLVGRLIGDGHRASADDADVELFAKGWSAWGAGLLDHVLGDFGALVYDADSRAVRLVRDPFGVRMLYFALSREQLVASNTLAAVLAAPDVTRALNDDAIADFVAVGHNEDLARTSYRDVRRIPPGFIGHVAPEGDARLERWWRLPELGERRRPRTEDYVEEFRAVLDASVADRLRSSSASIMMSGGLDSTSLASIARRLLPPPARITAVTVHSSGMPSSDELDRARLVASELGLTHEVIDSDAFGFAGASDDRVQDTPEPFDEPTVALWRAAFARAGAASRVVLYGEDPDTVLAPPDAPELLADAGAFRLFGDIFAHLVREGRRPHLGLRDRLRARWSRDGVAHDDAGPPWLRDELRRGRAERLAERSSPEHRRRPALARDLAQPLWQALLESLDAGTHGVPIDVRLPYLDRRVIEYAMTVPAIPWLQRKHLLREAMRDRLPDAVRVAPKRGQTGLSSHRLARWWASSPEAFVPSAELARFVDLSAMPALTPDIDPDVAHQHLRVRALDRWLRLRERG